MSRDPPLFEFFGTKNNRSLQVLTCNGIAMTEADSVDSAQENGTPVISEEASTEMTIEERKVALRRSRWNVFMYLGIAVLFFSFALFPFSYNIEMDSNTKNLSTGYIWGIPLPGEDFTDVPVDITIEIEQLPPNSESLQIWVIEGLNCDDPDMSIRAADETKAYSEDKRNYPNYYKKIDELFVRETIEIELKIDPGLYCIEIFIESDETDGFEINIEVSTYPNQIIGGGIGLLCLGFSIFAFIGAQKHGKFVRSLIEPPKEATIEEQVLAQTAEARISAGPTGPPAPGPTGPPAAEPVEPQLEESAEPVSQEGVAIETEPTGDVYEDQGDGWYFRKFADGTYDQTAYSVHEGQYIPYQPPDT